MLAVRQTTRKRESIDEQGGTLTKPTPYPFQEEDLRKIADNDYVALINIEVGGGKSLLAAWAAQRSGAKQVLIIAPKNTFQIPHEGWNETLEQVIGVAPRVIGNSTKAQREAKFDFELGYAGWYIVTPNLMGHKDNDISNWTPDFLISDEHHTYNSPTGKQAKKWMQLGKQVPMKLALSGTPFRRDFTRAWTVATHLYPHLYLRGQIAYSNRWMWARDRMVGETVYTSQRNPDGTPKTVVQWVSEAEPGRFLSEVPCVIQHFRRERCCQYHSKEVQGFDGFLSMERPQEIVRTVPLLPAQKRVIKDLEEQGLAWLAENPLISDLPMTTRQRIRSVCLGVPRVEDFTVVDEDGFEVQKQTLRFDPDCKSPVAEEIVHILNNLPENEPVLVHMESQRYASTLVQKLQKEGFTAAEYSGATVKDRGGYVQRFGKDIQVLVATTSAINAGTNGLQQRCSVEIFAERHIDDVLVEQVEARLDRMGTKRQVTRYILRDDLGISEGQYMNQMLKRELMNRSAKRKV